MDFPSGVQVTVSGHKVTMKGPIGSVEREFAIRGVTIAVSGNKISVTAPDLTLTNTVSSHLMNMVAGVTSGYSKKMQIIFAHFPISLETKGKQLHIKNFLGEKQPRTCDIIGQTRVEVKGQEVTISGISKEDVGQTVSNLKASTKISRRDSRVFQDGLYPVE